MKLALYYPWIYLQGGIERSVLELMKYSRHRWTIFTGLYDREHTFDAFRSLNVRELRRTNVTRTYASVLNSAVEILRTKIPLDVDTDAIVVWCDGIGDLVTFRNHSLPVFNICSTPLRAVFDPVYEGLALRRRGRLSRVAYRCFKHGFRLIDRMAWRNYSGVVATSAEVKSRILRGNLWKDPRRMVMAYPGVEWNPDISRAEYQPMILISGRIMWTKNIELGIRAFMKAALPASWRLVIAGFVDNKSENYLAELKKLAGRDPRIEFVVSPSDGQLKELYRTASFCLFTPLNEDWGIVPLEAMTNGKPVIAVARGGPQESVVDGETGFLLAPDDGDQWVNTIKRLALNPALVKRMGAQAHAHVRRFSSEEFARTIDDALEQWVPMYQPTIRHQLVNELTS